MINVPSPLLEATQNFTLIEPLVCRIGSLIFALSADVEKRTLEVAVQPNLIGTQFATQLPEFVSRLQGMRTAE